MTSFAPEEELPDGEDEETVVEQLEGWANSVALVGETKLSQKQRRKASPFEPKPLSKSQICAIAEKVKAGKINLPILDKCLEKDYAAIWSLADSGSAEDVANRKKHFQGATVTESEAQRQGRTFTAANGETIDNQGEMTFPVKYREGKEELITWQNADVELPIRSTKKMAGGGRLVCYGENSGVVLNPETCVNKRLVSTHGVYFIRMLVPKHIVEGHSQQPAPAKPSGSSTATLSPAAPQSPQSQSRPLNGIIKQGYPFGRPAVGA